MNRMSFRDLLLQAAGIGPGAAPMPPPPSPSLAGVRSLVGGTPPSPADQLAAQAQVQRDMGRMQAQAQASSVFGAPPPPPRQGATSPLDILAEMVLNDAAAQQNRRRQLDANTAAALRPTVTPNPNDAAAFLAMTQAAQARNQPPPSVAQNMPAIAERWNELTPEQQRGAIAQAEVIASQNLARAANERAAAIQDSGYDPLAGAITATADAVGPVVSGAAEAVWERTPEPVKEGIAKVGELADKPRQIVGRRLGGNLVHTIVNTDGFDQSAILGALPPPIRSILGPVLADPATKERVNRAYAEGGDIAVWEQVIATAADGQNPIVRALYLGMIDTAFDPLTWTGVGRAAGVATEAATAGTKLAKVGEGIAAATKGVDVAANLPGEAVVGAVKGTGRAVGAVAQATTEIPVIGRVTGPIARKAEQNATLSPRAQARVNTDEGNRIIAAEIAMTDAMSGLPTVAPRTEIDLAAAPDATPALPERGTSLGVIEMPERMGPLGVPDTTATAERAVPQPGKDRAGAGGSRVIPLEGVDNVQVRSRQRNGTRTWVAQQKDERGNWVDVGTPVADRGEAVSIAQRLVTEPDAPVLTVVKEPEGRGYAVVETQNGETVRQTSFPTKAAAEEERAVQLTPEEPPLAGEGRLVPHTPSDLPPYLRVDTRPERTMIRRSSSGSYLDASGQRASVPQYVADVVQRRDAQGADDFLRTYDAMARDKATRVDPEIAARYGPNSAEEAISNSRFYAERLIPLYHAAIDAQRHKLPRYRWMYGSELGNSDANLIEHLIFGSAGSTADEALARLVARAGDNPRLTQRIRESIQLRNQYAESLKEDLPTLFGRKSKTLAPIQEPQALTDTPPIGGTDEGIDLAADSPATYSTVIPGLPQLGEYLQRVVGDARANRAARRADDAASQAARAAFAADVEGQALSAEVLRTVPRSAEDEVFWATPLKGGTRESVWRQRTAEIEEGRALLARLREENRTALLAAKETGTPARKELRAITANGNLSNEEQNRLLDLFDEYGNGLSASTDARRVAGAAMERDYNDELVPDDRRTSFGRFYDEAVNVYREIRLTAPWNALRYTLGNGIGNTAQAIIAKQPMAAFDALDQRQIRALEKMARTGEDAALKELPTYKLYERAEMGGIRPDIAQGRTDMLFGKTSERNSALRRVFGKVGMGWVGKPTEITRNLNNGLEASSRLSLHAPQFESNLVNAIPRFREDAAALMKRIGVPDAETYAAIAELGPIFGPVKLRTQLEKVAKRRGASAKQAYGTADQLARKWRGIQNRADKAALDEVNRVFFSYRETNLDAKLRRYLPFHMWATRALPFYLENMAKNPVAIAAFYRANEGVERLAEREGWPTGLRGFVAVAQSAAGYELFLNPMATLGMVDMLTSASGSEPRDESGLGKWLRIAQDNVGVGIFPWFTSALNMAGFLGDSYQLDPTGMSREWGLIAYGANWLAANGYIDAGVIPRGPDDLLRRVRENLSGHAPGSAKIEATASNAYPLRQINQRAEEIWREGNGITPDQTLTEEQLTELFAVLDNSESPEMVQARKDWAQSGAVQGGISLFVPGILKTRQSGEAGRRERVDAAYQGVPTNDDVQWWKSYEQQTGKSFTAEQQRDQTILIDRLHNTTPEQRPIIRQEAEYQGLGTEQELTIVSQFNDIAYGDVTTATRIGGTLYTPAQLRALPDDQRRDLATAWLLEKGYDDEYDRLTALRDSYEATHPEYAAYRSWQRDARKAADALGGAAAWRAQVARENPNAQAFFDKVADTIRRNAGSTLTPSEFAAQMDAKTFTLSAYLAYQGRQEKISDPRPKRQDIPLLGAMGTGTGTGSGSSSYGGQDSSFSARLARAVPETLAALEAANADASARSGRPVDVMNQPDAIKAWLMSKYPELSTEDARIAFEYLAWAEMRRSQGLNDSQTAYVREQGWQMNNEAPPNALDVAIRQPRNYGRTAPSLVSGGGGRAVPSLVGR